MLSVEGATLARGKEELIQTHERGATLSFLTKTTTVREVGIGRTKSSAAAISERGLGGCDGSCQPDSPPVPAQKTSR